MKSPLVKFREMRQRNRARIDEVRRRNQAKMDAVRRGKPRRKASE